LSKFALSLTPKTGFDFETSWAIDSEINVGITKMRKIATYLILMADGLCNRTICVNT
jgi:hypothetical protein